MREIRFLTGESEIQEFLDERIRTDLMRRALREVPFLTDLTARFRAYPRLVFRATDAATERSNFTSWMNALALRDYENPAVNDLYYLHEISHIVTMPYDASADFTSWRTKMFRNELEASVVSEAFIYVLCPALRPLSFSGEIWVDRFLDDLKHKDSKAALEFLLAERDRIQNFAHSDDPQELRIHSYQRQNEEWARIWHTGYAEIEKQMTRFYDTAAHSPHAATEQHLEWLSERILATGRPYPFAPQVEIFARFCAGDKTAVVPGELKLRG